MELGPLPPDFPPDLSDLFRDWELDPDDLPELDDVDDIIDDLQSQQGGTDDCS